MSVILLSLTMREICRILMSVLDAVAVRQGTSSGYDSLIIIKPIIHKIRPDSYLEAQLSVLGRQLFCCELSLLLRCCTSSLTRLHREMTSFSSSQDSDFFILGCGSGHPPSCCAALETTEARKGTRGCNRRLEALVAVLAFP